MKAWSSRMGTGEDMATTDKIGGVGRKAQTCGQRWKCFQVSRDHHHLLHWHWHRHGHCIRIRIREAPASWRGLLPKVSDLFVFSNERLDNGGHIRTGRKCGSAKLDMLPAMVVCMIRWMTFTLFLYGLSNGYRYRSASRGSRSNSRRFYLLIVGV